MAHPALKAFLFVYHMPALQIDHVRAERDVLAEVHNPYVVKLYYSFQASAFSFASVHACIFRQHSWGACSFPCGSASHKLPMAVLMSSAPVTHAYRIRSTCT